MNRVTGAITPGMVIACSAMLIWCGLTTGHNWGDDFSAYIMQARSIITGEPARFITAHAFIVDQSSYHMGPSAYPWGFPLLLAPVCALFGLNVFALKSAGAICFLLFLAVLWAGFSRQHAYPWRLVLLGLFAFNPALLRAADSILSDLPFLLFSTACLVIIGRMANNDAPLTSLAGDRLLLGTGIAAAFAIRTNGVLLLAPLAVVQLTALVRNRTSTEAPPERTGHPATGLLPYLAFAVLAVILQVALPKGGSSHLAMVNTHSLELLRHHLRYYFELPAEFVEGVPRGHALYLASLPLAALGAFFGRRTSMYLAVYGLLTVLLYLVWPVTQGLRFIFPILPIYVSFVLAGAETIAKRAAQLTGTSLPHVICLLPFTWLVLVSGQQAASAAAANLERGRLEPSGPFTAPAREMFAHIKRTTTDKDVILFFKPRAMRLITGRPALLVSTVRDLKYGGCLCLARSEPEASGAQLPADEVSRLTEAGHIQQEFDNGQFQVYRFTPAGRDHLGLKDAPPF